MFFFERAPDEIDNFFQKFFFSKLGFQKQTRYVSKTTLKRFF